jgi:hypothetical protein
MIAFLAIGLFLLLGVFIGVLYVALSVQQWLRKRKRKRLGIPERASQPDGWHGSPLVWIFALFLVLAWLPLVFR